MSLQRIPGARLSFVVVDLSKDFPEGIKRNQHKLVPGKGIVKTKETVPAGFMVYFPRGHAMRLANKKMLRHYNLHREPRIINMSGLNDPNSVLGKMMLAQDDSVRRGAYEDLEKMVIRLATAQSGYILMPEQKEDYDPETGVEAGVEEDDILEDEAA